MNTQPYIGMILYGYCQGEFGRDTYGSKTIEAVSRDWIVVREEDGTPKIASFDSFASLEEFIAKNNTYPDDESI